MRTQSIIKAGEATRAVRPALVSIDLADHLSHARQLLVDARAEADAILASSQTKAREVRARAKQEGYDEGYRQGHETGLREGREAGEAAGHEEAFSSAKARFDAEHAALESDLRHIVEELDRARSEVRQAAGREVLDFAVRLARKVAFEVGVQSRETALANLARALDLVHEKSRLVIRANPRDAEALGVFAKQLADSLNQAEGLVLEPDEAISPGGCVVRTATTEIDATLETQMDEIVGLLLGDAAGAAEAADA